MKLLERMNPFYMTAHSAFALRPSKVDELLESGATVEFDNMVATFTYPDGHTFLTKATLAHRKMATRWINDYNTRRQHG